MAFVICVEPFKNNVESSENCESFKVCILSSAFIVIPLSCFCYLIFTAIIFTEIINNRADKGQCDIEKIILLESITTYPNFLTTCLVQQRICWGERTLEFFCQGEKEAVVIHGDKQFTCAQFPFKVPFECLIWWLYFRI